MSGPSEIYPPSAKGTKCRVQRNHFPYRAFDILPLSKRAHEHEAPSVRERLFKFWTCRAKITRRTVKQTCEFI